MHSLSMILNRKYSSILCIFPKGDAKVYRLKLFIFDAK